MKYTLYLPVKQGIDEMEIIAVGPAQQSCGDAERLLLDHIREEIEDNSVSNFDAWELDFLRHLKAGDDDMAWTAASASPGLQNGSNLAVTHGFDVQVVAFEVEV